MRYVYDFIKQDISRKMVFIAGPRQCGKTTLAKYILNECVPQSADSRYFNWDFDEHRQDLLALRFPPSNALLVFDELHKFARWKNWLKGIYDTHKDRYQIIVTGSARLDVYRRGGDSLLGRYHFWRLHPFGLDEAVPGLSTTEALERLLTVGGFPEPYLDGDQIQARRWRRERMQRIIKDDIRDLEALKELTKLDLFVSLLRARVGGQVVLANMASDLQVASKTLKHWLEVLERMYVVFSFYPYSKGLPRAIQKPPKVYFYDIGDVHEDEGARFENLVAAHLLKRYQFLEDRDGHNYGFHYVRDKEKREVDFLITKNNVPHLLCEAKLGETKISSSLLYYADKLKPKYVVQLLRKHRPSFHHQGVEVVSVTDYFSKTDYHD